MAVIHSNMLKLILLLSAYLLTHTFIRLFFSQTIQVDDAEQIRLAQSLALGYPIPQPPLYSWLSWGLFQLIGSGLHTLTLLKYTLIGFTFWFIWLASAYLYQQPASRWLATFSFLLMPSFGWHMHQGFTHTILLGLAIALTLHAMLRLQHHQRHLDYLYLGSALGIGLMAKYSFVLFLIPLLTAALTIREFRSALLKQNSWLILLAVAVWTTPHLYWLSSHYPEIFNSIDRKLQVTSGNLFQERLTSLWNFLISAIAFVTPWVFIYALYPGKKLLPFSNRGESPTTQLLSRFYLILFIAVLLLSLSFTMPHFKVRWFHPLMMLFPLWWLAKIDGVAPYPKNFLRWISGATIVVTLSILVVRLIQVTIGPELGHYSRLNRPVMETINQIPTPHTNAVLITKDDFLGAHLLSRYPEHAVAIGNHLYSRGKNTPFEQCLLLQDNDDPPPSTSLVRGYDTKPYIHQIGTVQYQLDVAVLSKTACTPFTNRLHHR